MTNPTLLDGLDTLVRETYALWDAGWVTFNWRNYTYDHVQRVRGLALHLGQRAGADLNTLELAALLHDITKPYDGEYLVDGAGKRLLDAQGYWRNTLHPPQRANAVTALYDRLGLAGQVHSASGASVARVLLQERGCEPALCERVAQAICEHLQPPADAALESQVLYDADTLDANIGLPAFVRNIYINLHFYDQRKAPGAPDIATVLRDAPLSFLQPYITDKLPTWTSGKERDFVPKLLTPAARAVATARLQRLAETWATLGRELGDYPSASQHGCLAVVLHYMRHTDEPSITAETRYLADAWLLANGANPQARALIAQLQREMAGEE